MNLQGKKLLVLGGTNNAPDINNYKQKEGVKIISAGLSFSDGIKEIADELIKVNILDREALEKVIIDNKIDGVFVGGNEDIISCVIDVTEKLGLPFYSSRKIWDTVMNKQIFKDSCRRCGVPTMEDFSIDESILEKEAEKLPYPVVIKPVDCCGSNGVLKAENKEDFVNMYKEAKSLSRSRKVTVEEFVDGNEVVVYYTFVDGKITISSMCDKYSKSTVGSFIPLSEIYAYPSKYYNQYLKEVDDKMRKMLYAFGIRNGITSMQGFFKDGEFKFFEMGFRLGGTAQYRYTEYLNGINTLHMMMTYALTGSMKEYNQDIDNAGFKKPCCTLTLLSKGGTIAKIEGIEEARKMKEVIFIENRYKVGDTIKSTRTTAQFHVRIFIVAENEEHMKETIEKLQTSIKAYDTNGESMLITHFDTNKLSFGDNVFE